MSSVFAAAGTVSLGARVLERGGSVGVAEAEAERSAKAEGGGRNFRSTSTQAVRKKRAVLRLMPRVCVNVSE